MSMCVICGDVTSVAGHFRAAHGVKPGSADGTRSDDAIRLMVAFADGVAAERLADAAMRGERPTRVDAPERIAAAAICSLRGNRYAAGHRLGVNGQTLKAINRLVDANDLPPVGSYLWEAS